MKRSIVHSKIQVMTHQYQRTSCSQYLLQMQVQAQPKCSNALTQGMIPYSHNGSQFTASESHAKLTLTKKNTMHNFIHRFARVPFFSKRWFLPKKGNAHGVFKSGSHTHKLRIYVHLIESTIQVINIDRK
ncbi:hypothetical protein H5410_027082 [Solanum commersonii]|uniref:Uncharacterized protein n=1 Tax=Solanum commersonii TaxID=4109 RepID=A0A9J5Z3D5_SOLCO|nr:hypothetical protein H5410_027082 [Solanum commersonii]